MKTSLTYLSNSLITIIDGSKNFKRGFSKCSKHHNEDYLLFTIKRMQSRGISKKQKITYNVSTIKKSMVSPTAKDLKLEQTTDTRTILTKRGKGTNKVKEADTTKSYVGLWVHNHVLHGKLIWVVCRQCFSSKKGLNMVGVL